MKRILTLSFALFALTMSAQLPDGSISPNFSLEDLDGQNHELYDYLDDGYSVILDFSATWCGPCWSYHQTGILESIWGDYGPGGEDNVMVFMIEADPNTSYDCIYGSAGCTGGSIGDWTAGVDYPILNPEAGDAATVNADFQINYFPTLYGVSPAGDIYEIGQASESEWVSWTAGSFQMHNTTWEINEEDCTTSFIDLQPVGGDGQIVYEWSNGATTEDLYNIEPGTYMVTMTDDNDYEVVKGPIEVEFNNGAEIDLVDMGHVNCAGGNEGYIEMIANNGTGDFDFEWSDGSTGEVLMEAYAGDYELVVTDNSTGCEFEFEFEIEEPDVVEYEYEVENPDCGENEMGFVEFDVDGGVYPYTFFFEDFDTQSDVIELEPGDYQPTIVDANGCETYVPLFEIVATDSPVAMTQAIGQFTCVMDSVVVSAENSSTGPNISYFWYNSANVLVGTTTIVQVDTAGMYTLEVHNNTSDCVTTSTVMVTEDFSEPTAVASSMGDIDCNNSTTMLSSAGSTADSSVVYTWSTLDGSILTDVSEPTIEVGSAGNYILTVHNMYSGCSQSAAVDVEETDIPDLELTGSNEFCAGSSTTICVTENGGETASWYVDGTMVSNEFCLVIEDATEIEVHLTDDVTGCESVDIVETVALEAPVVDLNGDLSFCEGANTMLCLDNPDGHTILWDVNGVTSTENCVDITTTSDIQVVMSHAATGCQTMDAFTTIVNANPTLMVGIPNMLDCNNSVSTLSLTTNATQISWYDSQDMLIGSTMSIDVAEAGEYTAVVMTDEGCLTSETVVVEANLDELPVANFDYAAADYSFTFTDMSQGNIVSRLWDFGDGNTSTEANPTHTYAAAGFYKVNLKSTNDCGESTHEIEVLATTALQLTTASTNVSCYGGTNASIQLGIGGGLPGYTFEWTTPSGEILTDQNISDLAAGTYSVLITDAAGATIMDEVVITEPDAIVATGTVVNSVSTAAEGSIELDVVGGNAPYTFLWSNGSTEMNQEGLPQGDYNVMITDANGCTHSEDFTVTGTTNVDELEFVSSFEVSPNPAVTFLNVNVEMNQAMPLQMSLISMDGKIIQRTNSNSKLINQRIDLSNISNGIYLVELRSASKVNIKKVIVAK